MKKITLFLIMLGFFLTASAQYNFPTIAGPTNVAQGSPVTINLNDVANGAGVPASSTGSYESFSVSADWVAGGGNPFSSEADITVNTTSGSIVIDPATAGGLTSGADTTLTFEGDFADLYVPATDGFLEVILNQSWTGSDADWSNIVVTLFETPTCLEPTGITSSSVTSNSATLDWTAGDSETEWNIEYNGGADFTPGNGEEENAFSVTGTPNTMLSGLTPVTTYYIYYQANCGTDGLSLWAGPFTFTTLCDVFIPDYLEDFSTVTFTVAPDCWEEADNGDITTGPTDLGASSWTADEFLNIGTDDGAYKINMFGTANLNDWIISPLFDLTGGPFQVEFDFAITEWNQSDSTEALDADDTVQLLITTDNGTTWTELLLYDSTSVVPIPGIHPVVDLTAYSGQTVQFAIYASEGTANAATGIDVDVFVDNFQVRNIPSCPEPSDMSVSGITADSAILDWLAGDVETDWIIEFNGGADFTPGNGEEEGSVPVTTTPNTTLTGLTPATTYYVYYQANCGPGDLSSWTGPVIFATECTTFVAPYTEGFENAGDIPLCWSMDNEWEFADDTGFDNIGNDGVITGSTATNNYFAWVDASGDDGPSTLTSPFVDVSGLAAPALSFYEISNNQGDANSTLEVEVWDGAAWNLMGTFNTNTDGWELIILDLSILTITGDVQARFIISETVPGDFTDDIAIDDVTFDEAPSCFAPTMLTANNLSTTSTEIGWTEAVPQSSWNIEYGITGFTQGAGTIESGVTTNPYVLTGLMPDTSYEFYVQAVCGPGDESTWSGPFQFFTGYCESIPSSNDGDGVTNVTIDTTDFPSFGPDETYENHTATVVNLFPAINTNVQITFATGFTYGTNIWIDFNDNLVFEDTELVYQGVSLGDNPTTLDASFVMPVTATPGEHRMRIGTADSGQATPNPCYNGSFGVTLDFTVNIETLPCTLPEATYTPVYDCPNYQYFVDVEITSLGDATSLEISNSLDATTIPVTATGTFQAGPFDFGTEAVNIFVAHEQETLCTISSQPLDLVICPPLNDVPCAATVATVNDNYLCETSTFGTLSGATASGVADPSCGGDADDDVWFQFVAQSEFQLIAIANLTGSNTTDINHSIYEGACDNLTEISCVNGFDETSSATPQLTIGETYFIRIYSGDTDMEDTTFDLCITPYIAPTNIDCTTAQDFCSGSSDDSNFLYLNNTINLLPGDGTIECLFSTPNPTYFTLPIVESGDILITMTQNSAFNANNEPIGNGLDVDFLLWGPYAPGDDLCVLGAPVDCSYSAAPIEDSVLPGAVQGEIYLLLITNFAQDAGIIQVQQTNEDETGAGAIDATVETEIVNLLGYPIFDTDNDPATPDELNACADSLILDSNSLAANEYEWLKDGELIAGETSSSLLVTESGTYISRVYNTNCGEATADSEPIVVNLYTDPDAMAPMTFDLCDGPENDGSESFDLVAFSDNLGLPDGFTVSFYTNTGDANSTMNPVTSPYTSTGEDLIMRIEDTDQIDNPYYFGCRELVVVSLVVNPTIIIDQPMDFIVCDDLDGAVDGVTEFDLLSINSEVTTDPTHTVTYHTSQEDADAGTGDVSSSAYSSSGETIYVRAENATTGCYETTSFGLEINIVPLATIDEQQYDYEVCPAPSTGEVTIGIVPTNFTEDEVSISWTLDGNPFSGSGLILDNVVVAGEYVATITFNDSGCLNQIPVEVVELESCVFPEGISPNDDMMNDTFDLSSFNVTKLEIFNRNGTLVYSKTNYVDEWHGQTDDGEELPVGTYFYTVIYEGGAKSKSAWVYINR
ncbi:fibronectin type III domain-containing protein [Winogradskyella schleiferi]|uniref:fibronectin type III domain-containing protein n=1 Tax=Winogradskyella schleiferi TaxID=2686078 RepID=UPI0015B9AE55|nr:gliding motility-associated C-terminal domain-containing protein [Winogradskyella schleiferi]